jgi:stage V sporulation protein B
LNRRAEVINKVDLAIKLSVVIAMPSFLGLFTLAYPILNLLFPGQSDGFKILQYSAISIPFIIIAQTSTSILQGIGKYVMPVINLGMGCVIKVAITFLLVPIARINIYGAVIGSIFGYIVASTLNVMLLKKKLNINIDLYDVMLKPIFASLIMTIIVVMIYMNVYNYSMSSRIACLLAILFGVVIYFVLIILFGVFKYSYIKNRFLKRKRRDYR